MFFAGGRGRGPENEAAYALLFSKSSSVNDMGSLDFALLWHSGGRRRFLFVVFYYNVNSLGSFLCCEALLFVPADVRPLYATVTRNIRLLSEAQDESILVAVGVIYRGIKVTILEEVVWGILALTASMSLLHSSVPQQEPARFNPCDFRKRKSSEPMNSFGLEAYSLVFHGQKAWFQLLTTTSS